MRAAQYKPDAAFGIRFSPSSCAFSDAAAEVYCDAFRRGEWDEANEPAQVKRKISGILALRDSWLLEAFTASVPSIGCALTYPLAYRDIEARLAGSQQGYYLDELFVAPAYQRSGVGGALLLSTEELVRSMHRPFLYLRTKAQSRLEQFYRMRGYEVIAQFTPTDSPVARTLFRKAVANSSQAVIS